MAKLKEMFGELIIYGISCQFIFHPQLDEAWTPLELGPHPIK